ncbi:MAG: OmpA family protein [Gemmatimonadales bacterium]|nr:OmpA family protein [Gemmatimonadales bacterium]
MFERNIRSLLTLGLLVALVGLAGCSCKDFEEQILQLNNQIEDLQTEVSHNESVIAERDDIVAELTRDFDDCKAEKAVLIEKSEEVIMITIQDQLSFAASQFIVLETMVPTLEIIANAVRNHPDWDVYVEGYTDSRRILEEYQEYYPSNWELGAFRASAVVRYMTNDLGLPAERFAAVSYGPFRPVSDNETEEGRRANRMVRVVIHKPER